MESLAGSPYPRDDAHHSHAGSASQRLLFRALDGRPHSPKYRFGSPAADAHETDPAPESPRHRGSFSDSWDAGRGPRSPGAWSPRSEDDGCPPQSPAPHRRKSLNPVRSLAVAPADEKARAQEGIVVLDVFSKLRWVAPRGNRLACL